MHFGFNLTWIYTGMTGGSWEKRKRHNKQYIFENNRYNKFISMEKKTYSSQSQDQVADQISAQLLQNNFWPFKSFSLEESNSYLPKLSFEIYEYNDVDQHIFQSLPIHSPFDYLELNAELDISSPKSTEGQSLQSEFKQVKQLSQNIESLNLQGQNQQKDYQASYHRGHFEFLRMLKTPIFIQSRKFCKSKRKMQRGKTYYQFIARYMRGYLSNSCKRFDQYHLQQCFKNLDITEQQKREATLQALRHLKKYRNNTENAKLLEKHKQKYIANRKWAVFLDSFVCDKK